MYWLAFVGCIVLYLCIEYPTILLEGAVLIAIFYFLFKYAKKSEKKVDIKTSEDISIAGDVIGEKEPINEEKVEEFSDDSIVFESEPPGYECEFIKPDEMPRGDNDSGRFGIRL